MHGSWNINQNNYFAEQSSSIYYSKTENTNGLLPNLFKGSYLGGNSHACTHGCMYENVYYSIVYNSKMALKSLKFNGRIDKVWCSDMREYYITSKRGRSIAYT